MSPSVERQREFAAALLDPACPAPDGIVGPDGDPSPRRFSVYRNNVVAGLTEILKAAFPATRRLVGMEFFDAMAGAYIRTDPPRSPILLHYGEGLPGFIDTFKPAASLPYLADVARIEWAWVEAYHAPDARSLSSCSFTDVPPDELPAISLLLHPSLRVLRSKMPVLTIWRMNVAEGNPRQITIEKDGEDVLVVRPEVTVEVRSLPPGAVDFIKSISDGHTVAEAAEFALAREHRFDLAANIAGLIGSGSLLAIRRAHEPFETRKAMK